MLGLLMTASLTLAPTTWADYPSLSEGLASFGGAVAGNHLYVYGGHVGKTHQHSVQNLWHRFARLDLTQPEQGWQDLGSARGLQGLALVTDGDRVCRVGGMEARNEIDDEEEDLISIDEVTCFDPSIGAWQALPPLPQARSSHDAVIHGGHLFVMGGWQLRGAGKESVWQENMAVLDLNAEPLAWREVPQPFTRRALAVAAADGRVVAFGGLGKENGTSRTVDIFDVASEAWSSGPDLPAVEGRLKGFGVSAYGAGDRIFLSAGDGVIHALVGDQWLERLAKLETPRFFHRLLVDDEQAYFVAGAGSGGEGHLGDVEAFALASLTQPGSVPEPEPQRKEAPAVETVSAASSWPGFRGAGDGHADAMALPISWTADEDVPWQVTLPGYGQSAPVIWGQQAFVTSVQGPNKEKLILSAFDIADGTLTWRRRFSASQEVENSEMVSRGAPTPVVDGERLYAFWESGDMVALDHDGETLWKRSLTDEYGIFQGNHGVASSPVLTTDSVIVQITHDGPSYVVALDKATGENRWKVDRPAKVTWTTPVVVEGEKGSEIVISAPGRVECLDASTGEQRWVFEGVEKNHIPSAVVTDDVVIVASSDAGDNLALRRGGRGVLGEEHVLWRAEGVASGFGSPLVHGDCVLFANKAGAVSCVDLRSGATRWRERLADGLWASPIAGGEHAFFFAKNGETTVLRPGQDGAEVVASNVLAIDGTVYGVAPTEGAFLVRTGQRLLRVGMPPQSPAPEATEQIAEAAHGAQAE